VGAIGLLKSGIADFIERAARFLQDEY